jgi:fructokinase
MTDVTAAALAEHRLGAAAGTRNAAYLTVGTGIGAGLIVHGAVLHGDGFPEAGHLIVRRHPDDAFAGCCPQHGDCAEGLAAGPAVLGRWGVPGAELAGRQREEAADILGYYVAQVVHAVHGIGGAERFVLGGGVLKLPGLLPAVQAHLGALRSAPAPAGRDLGPALVRPVFEDAGLVGALVAAAELDQ